MRRVLHLCNFFLCSALMAQSRQQMFDLPTEQVLRLADEGNPKAQDEMGQRAQAGSKGVTKSPADAMNWYKKSADQNYPMALYDIGGLYEAGEGVAKDEGKAIDFYMRSFQGHKQLAQTGSAEEQVYVAMMFLSGKGVAKNDEQAFVWYRKAAEQGNAVAENQLGYLYQSATGVAQDRAEGARWYRKAAEQGLAGSQDNLGFDYQIGNGVEKDYAEAVRWYRKAADQGDSVGENQLGIMYGNGWGVPKDAMQAAQLYRKSADQGMADAQSNLGDMYFSGQGVARDYSESLRWYQKSADQGNAQGEANVGVMYQNGNGVAKDEAEAARWYRKAAEQGNAFGESSLAFLYWKGMGVAKDDAEAARWYRKSADQGNTLAENNLGYMYHHGQGVPQDDTEAVRLYLKAAEQKNGASEKNLGFMYRNGFGVPVDRGEAVNWYQRAINDGDADAQEELASLLAEDSAQPVSPPPSHAAAFLNGLSEAMGAAAQTMQAANQQQQAQIAAQQQQMAVLAQQRAAQAAAQETRGQQGLAAQQVEEEKRRQALLQQQRTVAANTLPSNVSRPTEVATVTAASHNSTPARTVTAITPVVTLLPNGMAVCPASGHITQGHYAACDAYEGRDTSCTPGQPVSTSDGQPNALGCGAILVSADPSNSTSGTSGSAVGGSASNTTIPAQCTAVNDRWVPSKLFVGNKDMWLDSYCAGDVSVTWFVGKGAPRAGALHTYETTSATGNFVRAGEELKVSIYVCPITYPIPVKADGSGKVDGHGESFRCAPGNAPGFMTAN